MTKCYVFKSIFGYNSSVREGKIYNFDSKESFKNLLEINVDLIEIITIFRSKFIKHLKKYLLHKRFLKNIKLPSDLIKRELGIINFAKIIRKIENEMK